MSDPQDHDTHNLWSLAIIYLKIVPAISGRILPNHQIRKFKTLIFALLKR